MDSAYIKPLFQRFNLLLLKGHLEEAKQDLQGAQMLFTRAVALDPEHGTCLANRARCDLNSLCGHSAGSGTVVVRELKQPARHDSLTC